MAKEIIIKDSVVKSDELKQTVLENSHIDKVYFSNKGHHFQVYEHKGDLYARVFKQKYIKNGVQLEDVTPDLTSKITSTKSREEIINA